jgi:hypothetical protein
LETWIKDVLAVDGHPPGRSGKTNGIVIKAKMRAGRRQKLFRQEIGWRETEYAGVSDIIMTSA